MKERKDGRRKVTDPRPDGQREERLGGASGVRRGRQSGAVSVQILFFLLQLRLVFASGPGLVNG